MLRYGMLWYDLNQWDSNIMVWDSNIMIWDSNALLWNSNALLCYGVCCKRYTWTDCIILVDARLIKLCSAVFFLPKWLVKFRTSPAFLVISFVTLLILSIPRTCSLYLIQCAKERRKNSPLYTRACGYGMLNQQNISPLKMPFISVNRA